MPKINKIKSYLIVVVLFACLEVTCASFYPYILSYLIDNYKTLTINKIIIISILFLLSVILILLFAYLKKLFIAKYKKLVITKLKEVCFESIIKSDYSKFHEHSFDFYSSFIVNDIPKIYSSYYENLCYGFIRLFCNIVYLIILCLISWQMAIVLFVSSILIFIVPKVTGRKYGQYQLDLSTKNAALLEKTNEYFQSHDFINDNNIKLFLDKYKKELDINKESEYKFDRYNSFTQIFTGASLYIQMVIVFSIGLIFSYYGFITIGVLSSSLIFTDLLSGQMNDVAYILLEIKSSKALRDKYQVMVNYPTRKSNVCLDSINTINLKSVCYNINKELSYKKSNV